MKIIGIGGTNGSGKDTLGEMLANDYGYLLVSISDILRVELIKRGVPIERENLRALSAQWREKYGLGVLVDKAVDEFNKQGGHYTGLVIPSLRNPGEVEEVHYLGGIVVWTDGDPKIRYERIVSRDRSPEDKKSFEEFLEEEKAEMDAGSSATALHMAAVKARSDIFITNDSNDIDVFKVIAKKALKLN